MPLAPRPDTMSRAVHAQGRGAEGEQPKTNTVRRSITDASPAQLRILRHGLSETTAQLFKWMLDVAELSARDERVWKLHRRMLLDKWSEYETKQRAFVNSIYGLSREQIASMMTSGQARVHIPVQENANGND